MFIKGIIIINEFGCTAIEININVIPNTNEDIAPIMLNIKPTINEQTDFIFFLLPRLTHEKENVKSVYMF